MRKYIVKINGIGYKASGGFSFGAYDAFCKVLTDSNNGFMGYSPIPGGRSEGLNLMRFEAINHEKQIGLIAWIYSDN